MFLDACDALGRSPLKIAYDSGHTACAKVLGAISPSIVNLADRDGQTPFHLACSKGNVELIELLHRYGADLNTPSTHWLRHEDDTDVGARFGSRPLPQPSSPTRDPQLTASSVSLAPILRQRWSARRVQKDSS